MHESTYISAVGKHLPDDIYRLKLNLRFGRGVADSWYSGNAADLWVEYKFLATLPKIIKPTDMLSALQQDWLLQRHHEGRQVAMIIGSPQGGIILPGLSWQTAIPRSEFLEKMLTRKQIADWIATRTKIIDEPKSAQDSATVATH